MFGSFGQLANTVGHSSTAIINAQLNTGTLGRPSTGTGTANALVTFTVEGPHFDMTQTLIGLVVLAALCVIFFFVKRYFTNTMITGNVAIQKADLAGWALFMMLFSLSATTIFSFIASLWNFIQVFGPVVGINAVIIVFFIFTFMSAQRSKRLI